MSVGRGRAPKPADLKRGHRAATGIRACEAELIKSIADELGIVPAEVVYIAVLRFLCSERPEECKANKIQPPILLS